ncbi:hypothetical protein P7D22_20360 [Lichenihabitans sp. Uapishka_5]|uniref:hypothetical protein n=1 Tax=Lichenihabitans sp. Uapishka_5 TaxID=3037302 RepID=UPI0029E7D0A4|nr:hypothetical protein [Lichenihabitans sp. Uapishka_5]MDX7953522.1 hypothetical protein [Lichenihabitans sp. Uapishka_5]
MPSATFELLRNAVLTKRRVSFSYQGYHRETCPHAVGWKNGKEQVLVFQYAGESSKGLPPEGEWRCMPVANVADARIQAGPWMTASNHSQRQTCIDEVAAEVDY